MKRPVNKNALVHELQARIAVLEEENDSLAETAQNTLLLRDLSRSLDHHIDQASLIDSLLEHIGIVCDLPLSACFALQTDAAQCIGCYSPDQPESTLIHGVSPQPLAFSHPVHQLHLFCKTKPHGVSLKLPPTLAFHQVALYPFSTPSIAQGLFVFLVNQADSIAQTELFFLLSDACGLLRLKLDTIGSLSQLKQSNSALETQVIEGSLALKESQLNHRAIFEQAAFGIVNSSINGFIIESNHCFAQMLGYEHPSELSGLPFRTLVHPEELKTSREQIEALWRGDLSSVVEERRYLKKNGDDLWGRVVISVVRDPLGQPKHLNGVILDITQHKQTEAELHHVQRVRSLGQLAGGIAHDLNNVLTPIQCITEMLTIEHPSGQLNDDLNSILLSCERATALTQKILSFGRKQQHSLKPLLLSKVLQQLITVLQRTLSNHVTLNVETKDSVAFISGDAFQIEQIVMNLVINARDAMPSGGTITLRIEDLTLSNPQSTDFKHVPPGEYVRLTVCDTGSGISSEHLSQIFEPFFTTKDAAHGTGLGLSIVQGIIQQHHGFLHVHSKPNDGTCFSVFFPIIAHHAVES